MSRKQTLVALSLAMGVAFISPLSASATFMEKEINEQPQVVRDTAKVFYTDDGYDKPPALPIAPSEIRRIELVACGTSYHASLVSQSWFENYAHIPVTVSIASEFTKRLLLDDPTSTLLIFLSQSGTTTHTLDALRYAKDKGYKSISIVNNEGSPIALAADLSYCTLAGKETSVAATKSFTTQLSGLAHLATWMGYERKTMDQDASDRAFSYLKDQLAEEMRNVLSRSEWHEQLGAMLAGKANIFCLGSGMGYGMAREAALKLKETSYFKAEAVPLGELKHGPLAMLDEHSAVLIVATRETSVKELQAAYEEIQKRKSDVIVLASNAFHRAVNLPSGVYKVAVPEDIPDFAVIAWAIPIQQIALARSLACGLNPDQPRDLVKAVVTE